MKDFIQYIVCSNNIGLVFLLETHSDETLVRRLAGRLVRGWSSMAVLAAGASRSIALLWWHPIINVQVLSAQTLFVHAVVQFKTWVLGF